MSWVGLTAITILVAAVLLGAILHACRIGRLSRSAGLILALVVLGIAFATYLYPASLTLTHARNAVSGE